MQNFLRDIIDDDLRAGRHQGVVTRFPPEPNGYLHIGHAKSICLNFGLAEVYRGRCHLRFDDTNPTTEDIEFVEAIERDVRWLGFDWGEHLYFASDYYERLYRHAIELIERGKAYVCELSEADMRAYRGTVTEPGRASPYRERSVEDNLALFRRMRDGEIAEGAAVLRAKIDMASPNMKMRDPAIYRIKKAHHYRTGDAWCIYPLYDFTHCLSDAYEGITHSICTLEFDNNRELYDWVLANVTLDCSPLPHQYEFARLNLSYTMMSKRRLAALVAERHVSGWDDPRMPTIAGMRRRGVTPSAIRAFCEMIGVAKNNSVVDVGKLEYCIRDDLNPVAPRVMCVLKPLRVVLANFPEGRVEELEAPYFPPDVGKPGARKIPLSRVLYIERDDFMESPPKGYHRLAPGGEVRLRYGYIIRCDSVVKDEAGNVVELVCSYDPATRGGDGGRKVKGTIHWVSAAEAVPAKVRLYDRLFLTEEPEGTPEELNPGSLVELEGCMLEPAAASAELAAAFSHVQFERQGYFVRDDDSRPDALVWNRTVTLRDTWQKLQTREAEPAAPAARKAAPSRSATSAERASRKEASEELGAEAQARADRYAAAGVPAADARRIAQSAALAGLYEEALSHHPSPKTLANWVVNELARELKGGAGLPFGGQALGELVALVEGGKVTGAAAKEVLGEMLANGGSPAAIVKARGLDQVQDQAVLDPFIDEILAAHPAELARYRAGNDNLLGFFLGKLMKASSGRASPQLAKERLAQRLK
jgi:glutaminyl-tRNA synthetase